MHIGKKQISELNDQGRELCQIQLKTLTNENIKQNGVKHFINNFLPRKEEMFLILI